MLTILTIQYKSAYDIIFILILLFCSDFYF